MVIGQHRVERSGFLKFSGLPGRGDAEHGRAHGVGVGRVGNRECAVGEAVPDDGIGVELELDERLAEEAFGIAHDAAEPESGSEVGDQLA